MSLKILPEHVDPFRLAEQNVGLSGIYRIEDMPRLHASVSEREGTVSVDFQFGIDEQGVTFVRGHLATELKLQCQRCMEPLLYEIIADFMLGIVKTDEEVDALPEQYEAAMASEGELAIRELIEDELILNLPIIPKHEPEACKVTLPLSDSGWDKSEKGENPFQVLESLKREERK